MKEYLMDHTNSEKSDKEIKQFIEKAFDDNIFFKENQSQLTSTIKYIFDCLELGKLRVCQKASDQWLIHQWIKKAILLYFKISPMQTFRAGPHLTYRDKVFLQDWDYKQPENGIRVVPPATVRRGAYIAPSVVLMPSFVNVGAFIDQSTMVDTWATVGSCAQIGKNVHLSGGVGIGGVLEPLQASPVIIEDEVFIGSRCVIVEGVHIEEGAVLGAGVTITASTPIIDVTTSNAQTFKGRVPQRSVVIPGVRPKKFPGGTYHIPCALIIGRRSEQTDRKTSLTKTLRQISQSDAYAS